MFVGRPALQKRAVPSNNGNLKIPSAFIAGVLQILHLVIAVLRGKGGDPTKKPTVVLLSLAKTAGSPELSDSQREK